MSANFQIKLKNGQTVKYSDLSKRGIEIDDVAPEYKNIFTAVQKFINKKLNNENGSDGNNNVLSTQELSIFAEAIYNQAKGHNSKNLGNREFNCLMKKFEEAGVPATDLNFNKKQFLGFLKNLFDNRHNYDPNATIVVNQNSPDGLVTSLENTASMPIEVRDPETNKLKETTVIDHGVKTVIKYDNNEKPISETITDSINRTETTYKYINGQKIPEKEIVNNGTEKEEVTDYKLDDYGTTLTGTTKKKDGTKIATTYVADDKDNFDLTKPNSQTVENNDVVIRVQSTVDENNKAVTTRTTSKKTSDNTERKVIEDVVTPEGRTITEYDDDGKVKRKEQHVYETNPDKSVSVDKTVVTNYDKDGNATRVTRNARQEVVSKDNLVTKRSQNEVKTKSRGNLADDAKLAALGVDITNKGDDVGKSVDFRIPSTATKSPNLINGWKRVRKFNQNSPDVSSDDYKKCKPNQRVEIDCSKYKNVYELAKDLFYMEGFDPDNSPAWQARIKERAGNICYKWGIKGKDGKWDINAKLNGKKYLDMAANRPEITYVQEYAPAMKGTVLGDVKGTKYQVIAGDDGQLYYVDKNTKKSVDPKRVRGKIAHAQADAKEAQEVFIYSDNGVFGSKVKVVLTGEDDGKGNKIGVDENGHKYIIMSTIPFKASDLVDKKSPLAKDVKSSKNQKVAVRLDSPNGIELYSRFVHTDDIIHDESNVKAVATMREVLSGIYQELIDAEKQIHDRDMDMKQRDGARGSKFKYSQNLESFVDNLTFPWNMNREEVLAKLKSEGDKLFKLTNRYYEFERNRIKSVLQSQGNKPETIDKLLSEGFDKNNAAEFIREYEKLFGKFDTMQVAKLYATGNNEKLMNKLNSKVDVKQLNNDVQQYIQGQEAGREMIKEMPKYIVIGSVAGVTEGLTGGLATPIVTTMCATLWNSAEQMIKDDKEFDVVELAKKVAFDVALTYGPVKGLKALETGLSEFLVQKAIASGIGREAAHALTMSKAPLALLKNMVDAGKITDKVVIKLVNNSSAILAAETIAFDTSVGAAAEVTQTGEVTADGVIKYASISAIAQGMFLLTRGIKNAAKDTPSNQQETVFEPPKTPDGEEVIIGGGESETVLGVATGEGTHLAGGKLGETTGVGKNKKPGKMPKARQEVAEAGERQDVGVRNQTNDLPVRKQARELEHIWDDNAGIVTIGKEHYDVYAETDLAKLRQLKKKVDNWSDSNRPKAEFDKEKLLIQQKIDERIKYLEEHPEAQGAKIESEVVRQINETTERTVDRILSKDKKQVITEEEARIIDKQIANENDPAQLQALRDRLDGRFGITDSNHLSTVDKLRSRIDAKIKKLNEQADMLKATVDEIRAAKEGKAQFDGGDKVAKLLQDKVEGIKLSDAQKQNLIAELEASKLKIKSNTKSAIKKFKAAQAEKAKATTQSQNNNTANNEIARKSAMDILSDNETPLSNEDVAVIQGEVNDIVGNTSLPKTQRRDIIQTMYYSLENRVPQSPEVVKLKNYIGEQMTVLESSPTAAPRPEAGGGAARKSAMDILSDNETPISNEGAAVIQGEVNDIVGNTSLPKSQRRDIIQTMYYSLENRVPQSPEVVKLKNYISEQMKKLENTPTQPQQSTPAKTLVPGQGANVGNTRLTQQREQVLSAYEQIKAEFEKAPKDVNVEKVGNYARECASEHQIETLKQKLSELKGKDGIDNAKVNEAIDKANTQLKTLRDNRAAAERGNKVTDTPTEELPKGKEPVQKRTEEDIIEPELVEEIVDGADNGIIAWSNRTHPDVFAGTTSNLPITKMSNHQLRIEYERLRLLSDNGLMIQEDFARFQELERQLIKKGITVVEKSQNGIKEYKFVRTNTKVGFVDRLFNTREARAQKYWKNKYSKMSPEELLAEYNKIADFCITQGRVHNNNTGVAEPIWQYNAENASIDTGLFSITSEYPARLRLINEQFAKLDVEIEYNLQTHKYDFYKYDPE